MSFSKRQHTLESKLIEAGLKCATFNNPRNIYYVTGFSGASPSCVLLWAQDRGFRLYVPKLELLAAEDETVGAEVVAYDSASALTKSLSEAADDVKMVGLEKDYVTLSQAQWVEAGVFDITFMIAEMRRSKDQEELAAVWKAVEIAERGLKAAFESVKPGVKEREIAANAEYEMRRSGAHSLAFETTVASGANASKPHHKASDKRVQKGEAVVVDLGAAYMGYRSDLTRTVLVQPSKEVERAFKAVLDAQNSAAQLAVADARCSDVDGAARSVLAQSGFRDEFNHSLGHGVGLDVHEPPWLSPKSEHKLMENDVFTVEPGVYVARRFGIRIEDDYALLNGKGVPISKFEKTLVL